MPDAIGLDLSPWRRRRARRFERRWHNAEDVASGPGNTDMHSELGYVMEAVALIRKELNGRCR